MSATFDKSWILVQDNRVAEQKAGILRGEITVISFFSSTSRGVLSSFAFDDFCLFTSFSTVKLIKAHHFFQDEAKILTPADRTCLLE
ncbi:MAG TPA: hypothetical protein VIJ68_04675 [Candidatus Saccharimonadales bacterium]